MCAEEVVFLGSLLVKTEVPALHEEGMPVLDTYRHPVERELSVDFKLIGCCQPPAGVQQDVIELEGQEEVWENGSLLPLMPSPGSGQVLASGPSSPTGDVLLGLLRTHGLPHSPERTFAVEAPSRRAC